jgi:archaeosine synthase alpha-subunit
MRSRETGEGLALLGRARVGPLPLDPPTLGESWREDDPSPGLSIAAEPAAAGARRLRLSLGEATLPLELPVGAAEVRDSEGGARTVAEGVLLVHAPVADSALEGLRAARPALVVLGNARALWNEGEPFVSAVRSLRSGLGAGPVLWAPRVALPHRVPLLVYLGIDLLDTTEAEILAARGVYLDPYLGPVDPTGFLAERRCDCPGCRAEPAPNLAVHARAVMRRAVAEARASLRAGRLRELVEGRLVAEPALSETLRRADRELAALLEARAPVVGGDVRSYVLAEAHRRPEMARFRRRLIERYRPPPSKTVLLLVPCSRAKPYRTSRSHRRFSAALEGLRAAERVHRVSVSSPIGLVPRELEDVPPARHYDIPVTGEWTESERSTVLGALSHLLRAGAYRSVVVHLDPAEYAFLEPAFPGSLPVRWTLKDDRTTTGAAIDGLRTALSAALEGESMVPGGPLAMVREELREVASWQFGRDAADELFRPPLRLAGRPWAQRLTDGAHDLATLGEERGLFQLTMAGVERLGDRLPLRVEADPGVRLEGDLFVPGVRSADPGIRLGDAVAILRGGRLSAVGEAALPGPLMTELDRGLAVRVRHRVHGFTDTAMTPDEARRRAGPVV